MAGQILVAATRTDRTDLRVVVQLGLIDSAGVVVQATGDGEIEAVVVLGDTQCMHQFQHFAQFGHALGQGLVALPQRVQPGQRIGMAGRAHGDEFQDARHRLGGDIEIRTLQGLAYIVGATLVELVDLAQHQRLALAVGDALGLEETPHQLAVVELDGEPADTQIAEDRVDHRQDLGVEADVQRILADHVDVALVELAEAATLGTLATVDPLDLIATERERQFVLVLGHVAGQRHGQVEAQRQFRQPFGGARLGLGQGASGLHEIDLAFGLAAGFGQQGFRQLEHRRFHRQEAEALVITADGVQHALERDLLARQQFHHSGRRAWLDQAETPGERPVTEGPPF